jgi:type IV pilus assembly protein PilB
MENGLKFLDESIEITQNVSSKSADATSSQIGKSEDTETTSEVIKFVDDVLISGMKKDVSDVHVEHFRDEPRIRYRKDGVMIVQKEFNKFLAKNYPAVVTRLKIMAETNISERRLPQDGAIQFVKKNNECDFRVSFLPTKYGERVNLRLLKKESIQLELNKLGFEKDQLEKIISSITSPQGLILVTGPTGSGKTTTLYSCLNHINKEGLNILTAEDPVEYELHGISQVQVKEDISLTFASALRSFLRQDPDVILVGEIRDEETADIAIKAALTGHLVMSTLHTNDSVSTITRLINMGVPSYLISSALTLVMGQRLARANCPNCKKAEQINPKLLNEAGFSMEEASRVSLFKSKGCAKCGNEGYKGRIGIYEVLKITSKFQDAIINNASLLDLNQLAKKEGFITMQDMGRTLLVEGKICFEEYQRVIQGEA